VEPLYGNHIDRLVQSTHRQRAQALANLDQLFAPFGIANHQNPDQLALAEKQPGAPSWEVDSWVGSYEAFAAGELAQTSDTVRKLTGREPFTLERYFTSFPHLLEPLRTQSPS
jgi:hypothetical protein